MSLCVQASLTASVATVSSSALTVGEVSKTKLGVIEVTARKCVENVQELPFSISSLQGENLDTH